MISAAKLAAMPHARLVQLVLEARRDRDTAEEAATNAAQSLLDAETARAERAEAERDEAREALRASRRAARDAEVDLDAARYLAAGWHRLARDLALGCANAVNYAAKMHRRAQTAEGQVAHVPKLRAGYERALAFQRTNRAWIETKLREENRQAEMRLAEALGSLVAIKPTPCRWRSGGCTGDAALTLETTRPYFADAATRFAVCESCALVHDGTHGYPAAVRCRLDAGVPA